MPGVRGCQIPEWMPDTRGDARYQMPDRVQRMPDERLDVRSCFGKMTSEMETAGRQYMEVKIYVYMDIQKGAEFSGKGLDAKVSGLIEEYED